MSTWPANRLSNFVIMPSPLGKGTVRYLADRPGDGAGTILPSPCRPCCVRVIFVAPLQPSVVDPDQRGAFRSELAVRRPCLWVPAICRDRKAQRVEFGRRCDHRTRT